MTVYPMIRYQASRYCRICDKCFANILAGDTYFHLDYQGLMVKQFCDSPGCAPEGAEHARESYRKRILKTNPRRARSAEHEAGPARLPRQDLLDPRGETTADRIQSPRGGSASTAGGASGPTPATGILRGGL